MRASAAAAADKEAFLDGLLVRRELARNMCWYDHDAYDALRGVPTWAQDSLASHEADPRSVIAFERLERAQSPDALWNAAQREMLATGVMHNRLRMYWCKQLLLWHRDAASAFATALALNDRYMVDGRDPNGYMGIAWCFGRHDEPFGERPIFGAVRSMTAAGLKAKIDTAAYTARVDRHVRAATSPPLRALLAATAARGSISAFFRPPAPPAQPAPSDGPLAHALDAAAPADAAVARPPASSCESEPPATTGAPVTRPPALTEEQAARIKRNREAALSRLQGNKRPHEAPSSQNVS